MYVSSSWTPHPPPHTHRDTPPPADWPPHRADPPPCHVTVSRDYVTLVALGLYADEAYLLVWSQRYQHTRPKGQSTFFCVNNPAEIWNFSLVQTGNMYRYVVSSRIFRFMSRTRCTPEQAKGPFFWAVCLTSIPTCFSLQIRQIRGVKVWVWPQHNGRIPRESVGRPGRVGRYDIRESQTKVRANFVLNLKWFLPRVLD